MPLQSTADAAVRRDPMQPDPGRPIEDLVAAELAEAVTQPGTPRNRIVDPPRDLVGVALSGGGIRSGTFSLGLLQGLNEVGLLGKVDYLSTVSGGGYVGSFWTAWRSRGAAAAAPAQAPAGPAFPEPGPGEVEAAEVRHLREFSRFLAPRMGVFSWDTGRMLVSAISSMLPSLLAAFSVLAGALLVWVALCYRLFAPAVDGASGLTWHQRGSIATLALLGLAVLWSFEAAWRRRDPDSHLRSYLLASALGLLASSAAWAGLLLYWGPAGTAYAGGQRLPVLRGDQAVSDWMYLFAPAAAWGGTALLFAVIRWLTSRAGNSPAASRGWRASFDRVHGRFLFLAVAWALVSVLWVAGVALYAYSIRERQPQVIAPGLAGVAAIVTALFAKANQVFSKGSGGGAPTKLLEKLKPVLPQVLAYAALALLIMLTVYGLTAADRGLPHPAGLADALVPGFLPDRLEAVLQNGMAFWGPLLLVALAVAGVVALTLLAFEPSQMGLHAFYKGRIARAYLGASNRTPCDSYNRRTEEQPDDDLRMGGTRTPTGRAVPEDEPSVSPRFPVHLVCCAANDLSSDPVATLNRGAVSAVVSPAGFSVGAKWRLWEGQIGAPTLAHVATASGAAFNSLMGAYSVQFGPAVAFLMSALNLRLGLWMPHPTLSRLHDRREKRGLKRWGVGIPFFKEMFGVARADGQDVHLSDGGHFENMGVYELVRRHCRFIVAADCGADPQVLFNDFGNLVRRVREDFAVDIRIDLSPLRPDPETGLARQPMVAGDIHYPEGDTGILLLFKPTMTGSEPADVAQYRTKNPAFPHESTGDQFFDEAQWESYRRLGQHAANAAFRALGAGADPAQLFARARREWQPEPEGFDDRLSHFADRVAELDGLLRQPGCETLLRQVYKEIDELDHQDKLRVRLEKIVDAEPVPDGNGTPAPRIRKAATAADGGLPAPDELAAALHLVRRALLVMDEAYEREELESRWQHPLYLGLMNYFARWAYAPLFRMWWPILKALYPQPFTRFLEARFGMAAVGTPPAGDEGRPGRRASKKEKVVTVLAKDQRAGFAWSCWEREGHAWPAGRKVISYNLQMRYPGVKSPYSIQAAQVVCDRVPEAEALVWDAEDFFVPAGLWGVGIGEDFLRKLAAHDLKLDGTRQLFVRVRMDTRAGGASKQQAATQVQVYRVAGFREALPDEVPDTVRNKLKKMRPTEASETVRDRWMTCEARPAALAGAAPGKPEAAAAK